MARGLPILTSDRDFARWLCSDIAQYFDPLSPGSIVDAIVALPAFARETNVAERGRARLHQLPSGWPEVGARFIEVLRHACTPVEPISPGSPSVSMFPEC